MKKIHKMYKYYKIRLWEDFMSTKKRRSPFESVKREYDSSDKRVVILAPVLLVLIAIFVRWVSGSPLTTLHYIGARGIVPPTWLMVLLFSISYAAAGMSFGIALGNKFYCCGEKKYQGAMWFCICLAIGYAWYPIFFCARLFLVSLIMSALCLFSGICATICFAYVSNISLIFSIVYDALLIYLTFLNMQIFFAI
jgi:tryptophan-rich sensory protein